MALFTFVELRPMEGVQRELDPGATIGREGCDVVLADPEVSRRHAALRMTGDGPAVEDLGSSNGTWVNGERIEGQRPIEEGDTVRFGRTEWGLRAVGTGDGRPGRVTGVRAVLAPPPAREAVATLSPPPAPAATIVPVEPVASPVPAPGPGRRGDVPEPPAVTPSAVHRVLPPETAAGPPPFAPASAAPPRGSAATRSGYTLFCALLTFATLVALLVYLAAN